MNAVPDLADLGLRETATETLHAGHAHRLARTLDRPDDHLADGALPLPWIWVFFTPTVGTADLRDDGHPRGDDAGALAGLDRRMFIGGTLEGHRPVRLELATTRTSQVTGADRKSGASGDFVVVGVEHRYTQAGELVLTERQQILYRAASGATVDGPGSDAAPPPSTGPRVDVCPDERLLFRYSALTFNTHRIHYDRPYATGVEGYPGLVVHGPLTATLLCDLAASAVAGPIAEFSFRATAPTFDGVTLALVCDGVDDAGRLAVRAVRRDGVDVMRATARAG